LRATKIRIMTQNQGLWSFFGQLLTFLNFIEAKTPGMEKQIPTAAVNAKGDFFFNPKFLKDMDKNKLMSLMCHEILHLAYSHPSRTGGRDPKIWNIAADLKVNQDLTEASLEQIKGGLYPTNDSYKIGKKTIVKISTKTTEQLYQEIYDNCTREEVENQQVMQDLTNLQGEGNPSDDGDEGKEGNSSGLKEMSPSEIKASELDWQAKVKAASLQSQGTMPAGLRRELNELENPTISWHELLRQRFRSMQYRRTWKKPSKRWFSMGYYFQGRLKEKSVKCVAAIDTSGSIGDAQIKRAFSELWGLMQEFKFLEVHVMSCDAQVWTVDKLTEKNKGDLLNIALKGGGGTDFRPVFDRVHELLNDQIDTLAFFTDLYGTFPEDSPNYQTIWITDTKDYAVPFGRTVLLD